MGISDHPSVRAEQYLYGLWLVCPIEHLCIEERESATWRAVHRNVEMPHHELEITSGPLDKHPRAVHASVALLSGIFRSTTIETARLFLPLTSRPHPHDIQIVSRLQNPQLCRLSLARRDVGPERSIEALGFAAFSCDVVNHFERATVLDRLLSGGHDVHGHQFGTGWRDGWSYALPVPLEVIELGDRSGARRRIRQRRHAYSLLTLVNRNLSRFRALRLG